MDGSKADIVPGGSTLLEPSQPFGNIICMLELFKSDLIYSQKIGKSSSILQVFSCWYKSGVTLLNVNLGEPF